MRKTSYEPAAPAGGVRRPDLDWLRVLGVLLLVPFHSALVFNLDPGSIVYVKDTVQSDFLVQMQAFISRWHMPLLFAIAGAATWFARTRAARMVAIWPIAAIRPIA